MSCNSQRPTFVSVPRLVLSLQPVALAHELFGAQMYKQQICDKQATAMSSAVEMGMSMLSQQPLLSLKAAKALLRPHYPCDDCVTAYEITIIDLQEGNCVAILEYYSSLYR